MGYSVVTSWLRYHNCAKSNHWGKRAMCTQRNRCVLFLTTACESIIISIKFSIKKESTSLQLPLGPSWFIQQFCSPCLSRSHSPTVVTGLLHFSTAYGPAQPCGLTHGQPSRPLLHCAQKQKQPDPLKSLLALAPSNTPLIHNAHHVAKTWPCPKS